MYCLSHKLFYHTSQNATCLTEGWLRIEILLYSLIFNEQCSSHTPNFFSPIPSRSPKPLHPVLRLLSIQISLKCVCVWHNAWPAFMSVLSHSDQSAVPEGGDGTEQWAGGVTQPTQVAFQMANPLRLNLDLSLAHVFIIQFIISQLSVFIVVLTQL